MERTVHSEQYSNYDFNADPIVQLAVDNTRNILYCRTERGTIQVRSNIVKEKKL